MCLKQANEALRATTLAKLPDKFPCYKVIKKSGHCFYDFYKDQPRLTRGWHIAQYHPDRRTALHKYPNSFHAYLLKPVLGSSLQRERWKVVKCWAFKKDIVCIGNSQCDFMNILAVAVTKIQRK